MCLGWFYFGYCCLNAFNIFNNVLRLAFEIPRWLSGKEYGVNTWVKEEGMATHSSILAWEIPCTEEPGRLQSMGSLRVGYD